MLELITTANNIAAPSIQAISLCSFSMIILAIIETMAATIRSLSVKSFKASQRRPMKVWVSYFGASF